MQKYLQTDPVIEPRNGYYYERGQFTAQGESSVHTLKESGGRYSHAAEGLRAIEHLKSEAEKGNQITEAEICQLLANPTIRKKLSLGGSNPTLGPRLRRTLGV